jgi:hypothetical protein
MQDRPTAVELLEAVRRFLEEQVVPVLDGTRQFHARVAANVCGIVARELGDGSALLEAEWRRLAALLGTAPPDAEPPRALAAAVAALNDELAARIRAGDADTGAFREAVVAHLRTTAEDKLRVANPRHLGVPG